MIDIVYPNYLPQLAEDPTKLADEKPFYYHLRYPAIERIVRDFEVNLLSRFTDLDAIGLDQPVHNFQSFLEAF